MKPVLLFTVLLMCALTAPARSDVLNSKAAAAVLMDYATGDIIWEKNGGKALPPASISKLMTQAVLFEKLKSGELSLDDKFLVSEKAWRKQGSKMFVLVDTKVRIEDLIRGIAVQSGNDACIVVAEGIAGTEKAFAGLMNKKARELGMRDSNFLNATGWPDEGHVMSARDIAILSRYIIKTYPEYYKYMSEEEFTWSDIAQRNRNPLLYAGINADGLKTGHTEAAGYGLAGSAEREGVRRIAVVLGMDTDKDRSEESQRLLRAAFNDFKAYDLFAAGDLVGEADVWKGQAKTVPLMVRDDVGIILHRLSRPGMKVSVEYDAPVPAPVSANDQIAVLRVSAPGIEDRLAPLYAAADVPQLGIFGKVLLGAKRILTPGERPSDAEAASGPAPLAE
ncbi:MAG: D-alanyl-D-alanine carboxypeptidase family protein [Pseudomonadota bacterium]